MSHIELIASIDQGTQSSRVGLYDQNIRLVASAQMPHKQHFPQSGWVEHDPNEILENVRLLFKQCIEKAKLKLGIECRIVIKGLGVTNQRETTIAWNRVTGEPLYNAIVWLDTRTKSVVDELVAHLGSVDALRKESGLPINTYFSGSKILWLIQNVPEVKKAIDHHTCYFGTIDTWLIWNMTGGIHGGNYVTDVTNASRTSLMNIYSCQWSDFLLEVFQVPKECLPKIRSSAEIYGKVTHCGCPEFDDVVISGCAGDQQAACIGQGLFAKTQVKCTYGTGAFILINTGEEPVQSTTGLLTTPCYRLGPNAPVVYALEGSIAIAGAAISWLKDNLGAIERPQDTEVLLKSVPNTAGVYFVPAFSGLYAPRWRQDARGCIMGLTQHTKKAHLVRALMESVGFQLQEIIEAMLSDMKMDKLSLIKVDGGMSQNGPFLQITSDLCGCPVERPEDAEVTAAGAAIAAGLGCGFWQSLEEIKILLISHSEQWSPIIDDKERSIKIHLWNKAVQRSLNWV